MKEGSLLALVREADNIHDACAIALHYNGRKIGFIPAESNEVLSRLLDAEVIELVAEITHIEKEAATWENVHIAVSLLKEVNDPLPDSAGYLTWLITPEYHTLKHTDNHISRISAKGQNVMSGSDFYEELVENSKTDEIYDIIHGGFEDAWELEEAVDQSLLVIDRSKLSIDLQFDSVVEALEEGMITLENTFDENGYVVAQVGRVAELADRIERFEAVLDKTGRRFYEVVFKVN
jgi:uncharacterized protein Yka (UPF0111/DUF47 family)